MTKTVVLLLLVALGYFVLAVADRNLVQAQAPTVAGRGSATIRDDKALSDRINVRMTGVAAPAAGKAYEGWLIGAAGTQPTSIGVLKVEGGTINQSFTSPKGENLAGTYNTVSISVEPSPDPDPRPSGETIFSYTWPAPVITHAGHLLARFPATPQNKALAVGLREQVKLAQLHFNLALDEVKAGNLALARLHAEHAVNIIEGSKGSNYGDLNGNGTVDNPGDGFGVPAYAALASDHAILMRTPLPNDPIVQLHTGHVIDAAANITGWASAARDEALKAVKRTDISLLSFDMQFGLREMNKAVDGFDANRNGVVELVLGESGLTILYDHAQNTGIFTLQAPAAAAPASAAAPAAAAAAAPPRAGDTSLGPWLPLAFLTSLGLLGAGLALLRRRPIRFEDR